MNNKKVILTHTQLDRFKHALKARSLKQVKKILETTDVNACEQEDKQSLLIVACIEGNFNAVSHLLNSGANPNSPDIYNRGPLFHAVICTEDRSEVISLLLKKGANPDQKDTEGNPAIIQAILQPEIKNHLTCLLEHDVNPESKGFGGLTPLHCTVKQGYTEQAEQLIKKYHVPVDILTDKNETPLLFATAALNVEMVKCLLENGAKLNGAFPNEVSPLYKLSQIKEAKDNRATILEIARLFIDYEASLYQPEDNGLTAFGEACRQGNLELVTLLQDAGANSSQMLSQPNDSKTGRTILHEVLNAPFNSEKRRLAIVKILVEKDPSLINIPNSRGETPLHTACGHGLAECVHLMLKTESANVNATSKGNRTPLILAANKYEWITYLLLLYDADPNIAATHKEGKGTPLHMAAFSGNLPIVKMLVENSNKHGPVNLETKGTDGTTALYLATQEGHDTIVTYLISKNADILATNEFGQTAFYAAFTRSFSLDTADIMTKQYNKIVSIIIKTSWAEQNDRLFNDLNISDIPNMPSKLDDPLIEIFLRNREFPSGTQLLELATSNIPPSAPKDQTPSKEKSHVPSSTTLINEPLSTQNQLRGMSAHAFLLKQGFSSSEIKRMQQDRSGNNEPKIITEVVETVKPTWLNESITLKDVHPISAGSPNCYSYLSENLPIEIINKFEQASRRFCAREGQPGIVTLKGDSIDRNIILNGHEIEIQLKFEIKIKSSAERILCSEIKSDDNSSTLLIGCVYLEKGLHAAHDRDRIPKNIKVNIKPKEKVALSSPRFR